MKRYGTLIATTIIIVIVLVFIALVLVAFTYGNKYERESDRRVCILNIRNIQQAVRSHHSMNSLDIGDPLDWNEIFSSPTSEFFLEEPTCPYDGSSYILQPTHPPVGVPAAECPHCDSLNHRPEDSSSW